MQSASPLAADARPSRSDVWADILAPGDLVFDVGANMGDKTSALLECGARVVCVEPQPACAEALRKRFAGNPQVTIVEKGLADKPGSLTLSICSEANYVSTFSEEWKQGRFKERVWDKQVTVEVTTLEQMIKEHGRPKFCKVDVEGFELPVLQGLSGVVDFLSFEFAIEFLEQTRACLAHLNRLGFRQFNFSFGETQQFMFPDWVSSFGLLTFLQSQPDKLFWGDIYVRSPSAQMRSRRAISQEAPFQIFSSQSLAGDLWPVDRVPTTNDDLLLQLENSDVAKAVRCLYQIGAHRFEEHDSILRIFPNLEKIVLFEPNPDLFRLLAERFARTKVVQVLPYALSDGEGPAEFFIANNDGHSSSLLELGRHRDIFPHVAYERAIQVEQMTLSGVMARHQLAPPDMLFIDAQGAEYKILSALSPELKNRLKLIYVEASLEEVYQGASTLDELRIGLMPELKFAGYAPQMGETPTHGNAIFVQDQDYPLLRSTKNATASKQVEPARSAAKLPVGMVLLTHNSMLSLPGYLRSFRWHDLVEEIVVVDQGSSDGTVDYIKNHLRHPRLRIFNHPPSLGASLNFGVSQLGAEFAYLATTDDVIACEDMRQLVTTASKLEWDVLIRNNAFQTDVSQLLAGDQALRCAIENGACFLLGHATGHLYRHSILKKYPFPVDCGEAAVIAWAVNHAPQLRLGISPGHTHADELNMACQHLATIFQHQEKRPPSEFLLLCQDLAAAGRELQKRGGELRTLAELLSSIEACLDYRNRLQAYRRSNVPWIFSAEAWKFRRKRNRHRQRIKQLQEQFPDKSVFQNINGLVGL